MSKISDRIRTAALGPEPTEGGGQFLGHWVGREAMFDVVFEYRDIGEYFSALSEEERRMFLLFVAEALE